MVPLMPFSTINSMSKSVSNSNSTSILLTHARHANTGVDKSCAVSSSYISMHLLQKLSNTSANSSVFFACINQDNLLGFVF